MIKIYPSWFLFIALNLAGIVIVISRRNWLIVWVGLELTLLGFLPIFLTNKSNIEGIIKYMLVQAAGSALFLLSCMIVECELKINLLVIRMVLKLGILPFVHWVPAVIASIRWLRNMILSTVQKFGPLFVLISRAGGPSILIVILLGSLSVLYSGVIMLNQSLLRSIIAYSSISHTGWLVVSVEANHTIAYTYFFVYFVIVALSILIIERIHLNKLVSRKKEEVHFKVLILTILAIAGLPPFSIFILKVVILIGLVKWALPAVIIVIGSIISIYTYLMIVIPNLIKDTEVLNNTSYYLAMLSILLFSCALPLIRIMCGWSFSKKQWICNLKIV